MNDMTNETVRKEDGDPSGDQVVSVEAPAASRPGMTVRISAKMIEAAVIVLTAFAAGMLGSYADRMFLSDSPFPWFSDRCGSSVSGNPDTVPSADPVSEDATFVGIVERSSAAVVNVVATRDVPTARRLGRSPFFFFFQDPQAVDGNGDAGDTERQQIGSGTGFIVDGSGLVVTNRHVVSDEEADYTVLFDGGREYGATVLARDAVRDIAVLRIEPAEGDAPFPTIPLGDSDGLRVGQSVLAIGNSLGEFSNSVSRGIISGLGRSVTAGGVYGEGTETLTDIIQTDAAINPGNSGGPLLDIEGDVIGMNVAVAQGAENVGFAIPVDRIARIVDDVRANGKISMPLLGVRYAMIDEVVQKKNSLPYAYGAIVVRGAQVAELAVVPGSPADRAGIVENDIVLEMDGVRLDTDHPLGNILAEHRAGDTVTLRVWSKGEERMIDVTLAERPER